MIMFSDECDEPEVKRTKLDGVSKHAGVDCTTHQWLLYKQRGANYVFTEVV